MAAPTDLAAPPGDIPHEELVVGKIYKSFYVKHGFWKFVKYQGLFTPKSQNMLRFTAYKDDNKEYDIVINKINIRIYPISKSLDSIPLNGGIPNPEEIVSQLHTDAWERRGAAVIARSINNNSRRRKQTARKTRRHRRSNLN